MKATFLTGLIGFIVSLVVLIISVLLPILVGRGVSWREAAVGIVPGAIGSLVFLVVMFIGLFLMLNAALAAAGQVHPRPVSASSWSAGAVASLVVAIVLALLGLVLVVGVLPGALEARRVWVYQQARVERSLRAMEELEQRQDPDSQLRLKEMRERFVREHLNPEGYRQLYHRRMAFVGAGVTCLVAAGAIPLIRRFTRRSLYKDPS